MGSKIAPAIICANGSPLFHGINEVSVTFNIWWRYRTKSVKTYYICIPKHNFINIMPTDKTPFTVPETEIK